jgi:hypothetical protein
VGSIFFNFFGEKVLYAGGGIGEEGIEDAIGIYFVCQLKEGHVIGVRGGGFTVVSHREYPNEKAAWQHVFHFAFA